MKRLIGAYDFCDRPLFIRLLACCWSDFDPRLSYRGQEILAEFLWWQNLTFYIVEDITS
jgi:hypothetical protein